MKFERSIFSPQKIQDFFETDLSQIEKLYSDFSKLSENQTLYFLSEEEFQRVLKNPEKVKEALGHIINEVYFRFQFLFFINLFKFLKHIESLIYSWNNNNYLGWVLFGRSVIELCAVFNHFYMKLKKYDPIRTDYTVEEIQTIEEILLEYSHGTRFDWDSLIIGDFDKLKEEFTAKGELKQAINVLTAIDKLTKLRPSFYDLRSVYNILSDYAHPNMGSHSIFIDLPDEVMEPIPNRLSLNVNQSRGEFIIVSSLKQITICLSWIGHLLQETLKIIAAWGGYTDSKTFKVRFPDTMAVLRLKKNIEPSASH
jgi:hypothetical protein